MSYVTKLQTLSREDASKMIQTKLSLLALESLTSTTPIAEGIRKVDSYAAGRHTATIHKDSDLQEYKVKFMEDGKHHEPSDYFCDDLEDAKDTAKYQCDANHKKDTDKATK